MPALRSRSAAQLPALIQTDATRLRQVLVNLISNAIKFSPMGKVIALTAGATTDESARCFEAGCESDLIEMLAKVTGRA